MKKHYLSKSKIMLGRQCEKRLWLEVYRSHLIEYGADVEQHFAVGEDVNDTARGQSKTYCPQWHRISTMDRSVRCRTEARREQPICESSTLKLIPSNANGWYASY